MIGTVLIYYEEEVECWEIAYNLGKKYWGNGYTTEAMQIPYECNDGAVMRKGIQCRLMLEK